MAGWPRTAPRRFEGAEAVSTNGRLLGGGERGIAAPQALQIVNYLRDAESPGMPTCANSGGAHV
jgi:hypothetical protein